MHAVVPDVVSTTLTVKAGVGATTITVKDNVVDKWKVCYLGIKEGLFFGIFNSIVNITKHSFQKSQPCYKLPGWRRDRDRFNFVRARAS